MAKASVGAELDESETVQVDNTGNTDDGYNSMDMQSEIEDSEISSDERLNIHDPNSIRFQCDSGCSTKGSIEKHTEYEDHICASELQESKENRTVCGNYTRSYQDNAPDSTTDKLTICKPRLGKELLKNDDICHNKMTGSCASTNTKFVTNKHGNDPCNSRKVQRIRILPEKCCLNNKNVSGFDRVITVRNNSPLVLQIDQNQTRLCKCKFVIVLSFPYCTFFSGLVLLHNYNGQLQRDNVNRTTYYFHVA